jgi:hypothetical protein
MKIFENFRFDEKNSQTNGSLPPCPLLFPLLLSPPIRLRPTCQLPLSPGFVSLWIALVSLWTALGAFVSLWIAFGSLWLSFGVPVACVGILWGVNQVFLRTVRHLCEHMCQNHDKTQQDLAFWNLPPEPADSRDAPEVVAASAFQTPPSPQPNHLSSLCLPMDALGSFGTPLGCPCLHLDCLWLPLVVLWGPFGLPWDPVGHKSPKMNAYMRQVGDGKET